MSKEELVSRFLGYTKINTTTNKANGEAGIMPSNPSEFELANIIKAELEEIGLVDVNISEKCIITGTLKGNADAKSIAFCAHLDTSSECTKDTKARIVKYTGKPIELGHGAVLDKTQCEELDRYLGEDLIITDGSSLLGADDKAGIAAVVQAFKELKESGAKHGDVKVLFVPDEEQGLRGSKAFVNDAYADFGYCLDAGALGEFCYENWNAGNVEIVFKGQSAHPMSAKGKLINSLLLAHKFISMLPGGEAPEYTEGKEGYYWVKNMEGNSAKTVLKMDIRDFSFEGLKNRAKFLEELASSFNRVYGRECALFEWNVRYENVNNLLAPPNDFPIKLALDAFKNVGVKASVTPMRGGYDGAVLSGKGLPCPNIFTGAHNFHSIYEFCPVNSLEAAKNVVKEICILAAK